MLKIEEDEMLHATGRKKFVFYVLKALVRLRACVKDKKSWFISVF
jgi:hypothetical protein